MSHHDHVCETDIYIHQFHNMEYINFKHFLWVTSPNPFSCRSVCERYALETCRFLTQTTWQPYLLCVLYLV